MQFLDVVIVSREISYLSKTTDDIQMIGSILSKESQN